MVVAQRTNKSLFTSKYTCPWPSTSIKCSNYELIQVREEKHVLTRHNSQLHICPIILITFNFKEFMNLLLALCQRMERPYLFLPRMPLIRFSCRHDAHLDPVGGGPTFILLPKASFELSR